MISVIKRLFKNGDRNMPQRNRCRNFPECRNYEFKFGFCKDCYMIFLQEKILEAMVFGPSVQNQNAKTSNDKEMIVNNQTKTFIPSIEIPESSGNIKISENEREASDIDKISGKLESLGR